MLYVLRLASILILFLSQFASIPLSLAKDVSLAKDIPQAQDARLAQQRTLYGKVKKSLDRGSTRLFEQHQKQLQGYALFPYLEYSKIAHRLSLSDEPAIDKFLADYPDIWLSARLRRNWLKLLYSKRQWQHYIDYYRESATNTDAACHLNFARYQIGEKQPALDGGLKLWLVGKSQPKACDPLFRLLIAEQRISDDVAWQRYSLAILNHEYRLGRYIERFFTSDKYRKIARNYVSLDRRPARVGEYRLFAAKSPEILAIIEHGIRHLAKQNATLALKHWARYLQSHPFDEDARRRVLPALVKGLHRQGYDIVAAEYLHEQLAIADVSLLEWQLRYSLEKGDWEAVTYLIKSLPEEIRGQQKWRYWQARALILHTTDVNDIDIAKTTFRELSRFRSFYGFLASDWVDNPYRMQHQPTPISTQELAMMEMLPGIQRTRELLFHQQNLNARREWYALSKQFTSREWQTAAYIAQKWRWHGQAILAMAKAEYWDDIDLRFPLVFRREFERHAQQQGLPLPLLFALARQESAFRPNVTSPAGARGLMQLMPATAKEVASKHKIRYRRRNQLFDPNINIHLGSQYYRDVLRRFSGNRILATAAYNAGPHRVKRWLKKSAQTLPFDAWVETIPYKETRQYVQNVLAFAVIYSHHLKRDDPFLSAQERAGLL